jgi:hypothetical protein
VLRDGYGNDDDSVNFGWNWGVYTSADSAVTPLELVTNPASGVRVRIQSEGFDSTEPGDDYPAGNLKDIPALINEFDHRVNLVNWDSVTIRFENLADSAITVAQSGVKLALTHAVNTVYGQAFPDRTVVIPSPTAPASGSISVSIAETLTVPAGSSLSGTDLTFTTDGLLKFPNNVVSVSVASSDTVTVPSGSSLLANALAIGSNGSVSFPSGSSVNLNSALLGSLPDKYGRYSLILVCDTNDNRFDGDPSTDGCDTDYKNQPYLFDALSRSTAVTPPSPLIWTIE